MKIYDTSRIPRLVGENKKKNTFGLPHNDRKGIAICDRYNRIHIKK